MEPLAPPGDARAVGPQATPHVALLQPGEAIIVPRCVHAAMGTRRAAARVSISNARRLLIFVCLPRSGWWHYAAAVSPSLTAQANFYCVGESSNAEGLIKMVVQRLRAFKNGAAARP